MIHHLPRTSGELLPLLPKFKAWLEQRGGAIVETTNEWELLRFKAQQTAVIYTTKTGKLTFTGGAKAALDAFRRNASWSGSPATPRKKVKKDFGHLYRTLRKRDGNDCFYCLCDVSEADESIEHIVSRVHGGPNHPANFALAHRDCNAKAGHLSVMEKIAIHVAAKLQRATAEVPA